MKSSLVLLRQICTVGLCVALPQHRIVSRWLRSHHSLMEGCLDLVLADVPDVIGVQVGSPVEPQIIVPFL